MKSAVLVINAGSATLKYALYSSRLECVSRGIAEGASQRGMLKKALADLDSQRVRIVAAGHRVVHGGDRHARPCLVTPEILKSLEELYPLAPLHQPHNVAGIRAVAAHRPALPQVACFDTAFHQSQPEIARMFALPASLRELGIKRYGFHGLSYEYVALQLSHAGFFRKHPRVIVAHLGNGSSMCALLHGRSVATSMGFTALEGLVMGTRAGSIDPGVLLYLMEERGMTAQGLTELLYRKSGLLGVSGLSADMRTLLASREPEAKLAIDLYVYRAAREVGSLAAALGGVDALVFTGGIGEHAAPVREAIVKASRWLGGFEVAVVPTNEEEMIARHTLQAIGMDSALENVGAGRVGEPGVSLAH